MNNRGPIYYRTAIAVEHSVPFILTGSSMAPNLPTGQRVYGRHVSSLIPGNCYFFLYKSRILLHRLVRREGDEIFLMGDNSGSIERVHISDIIAELAWPSAETGNTCVGILNYLAYKGFFLLPPYMFSLLMRIRTRLIGVILRVPRHLNIFPEIHHERRIPET